jgi:hypothetical protein
MNLLLSALLLMEAETKPEKNYVTKLETGVETVKNYVKKLETGVETVLQRQFFRNP